MLANITSYYFTVQDDQIKANLGYRITTLEGMLEQAKVHERRAVEEARRVEIL